MKKSLFNQLENGPWPKLVHELKVLQYYHEGRKAFENHKRHYECPYDEKKDPERYYAWQDGFEEAYNYYQG